MILAILAALLGAPAVPGEAPPATSVVPAPAPDAAPAKARASVTILIGVDGARADYLARGWAPRLSALAAAGASGPMRPSFPSKTFPNHWTLVTGLRPDVHGIVANMIEDARRPGEHFTMATDDPFWWNEAMPVWVAAEAAGIRTATMFWPGSNVAWGARPDPADPRRWTGGTRPSDWQQFNQAVSDRQRVNAVLDWMRRPADIRPRLVTLYFDTVDTAGHRFGPDDPRTAAAMAAVDGEIGLLVDELAAMGQPADIVVVADHGMAAVSDARVIALDRILRPGDARLVETGPYATLEPAAGRERAVARALARAHDDMQCWPKGEIPARLAYGRHPRVPAWLCLAAPGWTILPTATPERPLSGGAHGYDPEVPDMAALFVANGPAIRPGTVLAPFDNVAVEPLLRRLVGLPQRDAAEEGLETMLAAPPAPR